MKNSTMKFLLSPSKITFLIVIIPLIYAITSLFLYNLKKEKYAEGFSKIEVGMPKESVIELLGNPSELNKCNLSIINQKDNDCIEVFWYKATLERWGVYFNKQDKVIDKIHNVSY